MGVTIREVTTKKELKEFILFPHKLYGDNPYWVPPLHFDEINTLSNNINPAFEFCKAKYWLAYNEDGIAGRIAGIINEGFIKKWGKKYARFGWIDFIDDPDVSKTLLATVEDWAKKNGMEGIQGPLGFTDFDKEGMLIEGFSELGTIAGIYNHSYYPEHLEKLSYNKEIDWLEFQIKVSDPVHEKVKRMADIVERRHKLKVVRLKKTKDILAYTKDVFKLLNDSYKNLFGFVPLTDRQVDFYTKQYFSFIRPEFVQIVLDSNDKLAAMGFTMPSLSKALQKAKGRLFPFGFIHLLKAISKNDKVDLLLIAVREDFQGKGLNAILMREGNKVYLENNISFVEASHELETNERILSQWGYFETRQHKRRRCFMKKI